MQPCCVRCTHCLANMQTSEVTVLPGCILAIALQEPELAVRTWNVHCLLLSRQIYLQAVMFCLSEDGPSLPIPIWLPVPGDYDLFLSQISIPLGQRINTKHITSEGNQIAPKGVKINPSVGDQSLASLKHILC